MMNECNVLIMMNEWTVLIIMNEWNGFLKNEIVV